MPENKSTPPLTKTHFPVLTHLNNLKFDFSLKNFL